MKSLKAAAIVAGSLVVAGFATPAVAAGGVSADLDRKVGKLAQDLKAPGLDGQKMLDTEKGLVPKAVEKTTDVVEGDGRLVR
ncbi:hypothetical protein [Streptomyces ureilyticus]|uniref:Secreted protein n=1 Tax=Streptomyces ureilyticus TaxID=1775131 RepID=A0ABX0E8T2_9ACTN|nr:hypothetical protein [Streptomyces ureilyticus]NGO48106.1 hypothetical protein [Streptomyces ureilyticus]